MTSLAFAAFALLAAALGLVAPHLSRVLVGKDQHLLVPAADVIGSSMMVGASILSKLISPGAVVPAGIVTAVIGILFLFGQILWRRQRFWRRARPMILASVMVGRQSCSPNHCESGVRVR